MDQLTDPVIQVASEIVRYLEEHPDASDVSSGIRDFWLGGFPMPKGSWVLDEALDRLVSAGVLMQVLLPGGESIYRLIKKT
ncbi:hypothetical protein AWB81_07009 [Caballeronia arationis]|uniref:hypothetical protein n=1 Tax=Caballeronia arationis TaxID=1777142 RepID=UPI00074C8EFB|nr:hypothetical protein [Caballeronia arationis]SAL05082.1 hypothetical protein AWB81_07009 [Caballeronia arationis]